MFDRFPDTHRHTRRSVLRAAAGTLSIGAVGSLSGCQGFGGGPDSSGERWPVTSRLDAVPEGVWTVTYVHVGDLLSDPATAALFDAYFARQAQGAEYDGPGSLSAAREQFNGASPVLLDDLHEVIGFNGNLLMGIRPGGGMVAGMVLWTDWEESAIVDGIEETSEAWSLTAQTYQGQTMYVPGTDAAFLQPPHVGVFGDGQYVVGDRRSVQTTIDVVAGDASPVDGTIRELTTDARSGPVQFASDVPRARLEEQLQERPGSAQSGGFLGQGRLVGVDRISGSLYVAGDARGVELTVEAVDSETASGIRSAIETRLDGAAQSMESEDPFQDVLADTSIDASGSTVTLSYEATVSDIEGLSADLADYQPPTPTPDETTSGPALLQVTDAVGTDISADGIGALELTVALGPDVPEGTTVDLTETRLVLIRDDQQIEDELGHVSGSARGTDGTFSTPGGTTLETAGETIRLRVDLGADTAGYESDPVGDPIPAGSTASIVLIPESGRASPATIVVPETLAGETVDLELSNPVGGSRPSAG
ncbi:MAG: hypothetical protein ACI8XM_002085 [Haloarculaceae archaeon]|jgi:hypothetical protein